MYINMTSYEVYSDYVGSICSTKSIDKFKSDPRYTHMLEHVSKPQGEVYLECISQKSPIAREEVINFCAINDANGSPKKEEFHKYIPNVAVSPSSLRYIYHAHMILSHMKGFGTNEPKDIVEIGGGYGGLCLAVHYFAPKYGIKINSYTICDLTNIICLQELYLNKVDPNIKVNFVDAATYGANIPHDKMFLISNYCFSEISMEHQTKYREHLFPKVSHGFFAWNCIPIYDMGIQIIHVETEVPNTGGAFNKYVWF
jgi:putative sugar O-methyltransferase